MPDRARLAVGVALSEGSITTLELVTAVLLIVVPIAYLAWSIWLIALGVFLLVR